MDNLTVLDFSGAKIRFEKRGDRVWVSLTDMAKATGKLVADYTRSKSSIEFIAELESIMGIPIIDSKVGGAGIPEIERGTWAIEEVAVDFAAWCNVKFRIWVSQQIKTLMTEGTVSIMENPIMEPPKLGASVEATVAAVNPLRSVLTSLAAPLVDGFILNEIQRYHPELKATVEAAHSLLAANTPIPEVLLTPTAIGLHLGCSAKMVNSLLVSNGYQCKVIKKSSKTQPDYVLTEKGEALK